MRLDMHTARFFDVNGSHGSQARRTHRGLLHHEPISVLGPGPAADRRRQLQNRRRHNDQLPSAQAGLAVDLALHCVANNQATTKNTLFKFLGIPLFYLPYLRHPVEETGRESGLLIPGDRELLDARLDARRAGLHRAQPQHGHGGRHGVLQQARLGAQRRLPLQGAGPRSLHCELECPDSTAASNSCRLRDRRQARPSW